METPLHSPPPVGRGVYWAVRQDWRLPVLIGFSFFASVVVVLLPHFSRLDRLQKETFAEVGRFLETEKVSAPPPRSCVLSREDSRFHWRGLVWKDTDVDHARPLLFSVEVETDPQLRVLEQWLRPYNEDLAHALDVFDAP